MKEFKVSIVYEKSVEKFLDHHSQIIGKTQVRQLILKSIKKLCGVDVNIDLVKMKGTLLKRVKYASFLGWRKALFTL
jgi:hypothetical protein